jgi:pimeloyl-ACP methyl ester carboxylesterase
MRRRFAALIALLPLFAVLGGCAFSGPPLPTATTEPVSAPTSAEPVSAPTSAPLPSQAPSPEPSAIPASFAKNVSVGDYTLFISCDGEGSPAVILDAGLGGNYASWAAVQPDVARFTRVCSYDRAGMGRSDPGPTPRTSQQIVTELHALLSNAGVPGPYVLVGHSFGGFNVRLYASQYPDEVAGLVLVESTHEDQDERILAALPPEEPDEHPALAAYRQELRQDVVGGGEPIAFKTSAAQVRDSGTLGALPLVVISGGQSAFPQFSPESGAKLDSVWRELQSALLRLSTNSRQVIAERSGHGVPYEQPDLVIDEIRQMVQTVRRQ